MLKKVLFSLCCAAFMSLPGAATAQTKDRLDTRGALLGWEAVGRLDLPGGRCTGALIARDIVLTAAHCVVDAKTGRPFAPQGITFRAGHAHGKEIAARSVSKLVVDPAYRKEPGGKISGKMMVNDLALLELASPMHEHGIDPYVIFDGVSNAQQVILASYGQGRMESLMLERDCLVQERYRGGIFGFDCDATFGSSGAPVFLRDNGRLRIVSVISAIGKTENGRARSFGMSLPKKVANLKVRLRNMPRATGAKINRVQTGARSGTAGRFVKARTN